MAEGTQLKVVTGDIFEEIKPTDQMVELSEVALLTPVSPSKLVCVGQNYREHIQELGMPVPKEPIVFLTLPSCLIGSGEKIVFPAKASGWITKASWLLSSSDNACFPLSFH